MKLIYRGRSYRPEVCSVTGIDTGLKTYFRGISYRLMATRCEDQYSVSRRSY